jgi:hypothetical protein
MRPRSIILFERLFLASLAAGLVQAWLGWPHLIARAAREGHGPGAMLALLALTFFTLGALSLLVSRGRQPSAKWVLTILCAIGLPLVLASVAAGNVVGSPGLALVQACLQVGSLALLFTAEARAWLSADAGR